MTSISHRVRVTMSVVCLLLPSLLYRSKCIPCVNNKDTCASLTSVVFMDMLGKYQSSLKKINITHKFYYTEMTTANILGYIFLFFCSVHVSICRHMYKQRHIFLYHRDHSFYPSSESIVLPFLEILLYNIIFDDYILFSHRYSIVLIKPLFWNVYVISLLGSSIKYLWRISF